MKQFSGLIEYFSNLHIMQYLPKVSFEFMTKLVVALIIMITSKIIIRTINPMIKDLCNKTQLESHTCVIITKIIKYLITLIAAIIALQNLGVNVSMLIATLGITGFAFSYGIKDIVANFIAGILILGYKQFKIHDYIKIKDWEGKVLDINLRYTTIEYQNMIIYIPNIVLYTNTVAVIKEK